MIKKQIIQEEVAYPLDWTYGVSLAQLKDDLAALEKLGVTSVNIETEELPYDGGTAVSIKAFIRREETDQEFKERRDKIKSMQKRTEEQELETLKRLKEKYKDK